MALESNVMRSSWPNLRPAWGKLFLRLNANFAAVEGVMVVTRRMSWLLASTVLGTSMIAFPAFAQDAQNQQKMQNQINSLQQQLQTLQDQVAQNKIPAGLYNQAPPLVTKGGPAWLPTGLQFSLAGSFLAMEGVFRQHNEVSDGASDPPFGNPGIPLQNSVLYHE